MSETPFTTQTQEPHVTVGTGTLVEAERCLLEEIRKAVVTAEKRGRLGLVRILGFQSTEIEKILHLIEQRQALFPCPDRFLALQESLRFSPSHTLNPLAVSEETLSRLISAHTAILSSLNALIHLEPSVSAHEPLLREALSRHEEMIWMLSALDAEDRSEGRGGVASEVFSSSVPSVRDQAENAWENDGGGNPRQITSDR